MADASPPGGPAVLAREISDFAREIGLATERKDELKSLAREDRLDLLQRELLALVDTGVPLPPALMALVCPPSASDAEASIMHQASTRDANASRVADEIEAMQAIYGDDVQIADSIVYVGMSVQVPGQSRPSRVRATLFLPGLYPDQAPVINLEGDRAALLPGSLLAAVERAGARVAAELLGAEMLYEIVLKMQDVLQQLATARPSRASGHHAAACALPAPDDSDAAGAGGGTSGALAVGTLLASFGHLASKFVAEEAWLSAMHADPAASAAAGFDLSTSMYPTSRYIGPTAEMLRHALANLRRESPAASVVKLETVLHPLLAARFELQWAAFNKKPASKCAPEFVFHGTSSANMESIIRNGLVPGGGFGVGVAHGTALGSGVYTSKFPSFALHYADLPVLLVCAILRGQPQVDYVGTGDDSQIVLSSPAQVLPVFVMSISFTNHASEAHIHVSKAGAVVFAGLKDGARAAGAHTSASTAALYQAAPRDMPHGPKLDQEAMRKKLEHYFGDRLQSMQVLEMAPHDDDDDDDEVAATQLILAPKHEQAAALDAETEELQRMRAEAPVMEVGFSATGLAPTEPAAPPGDYASKRGSRRKGRR